MTRQEVHMLVAQYIIAIGVKGEPSSHVWLAIDKNMSNLFRHQETVAVLIEAGLVKEQFHFLTLTQKGMEMHNRLVALYAPSIEKPVTT